MKMKKKVVALLLALLAIGNCMSALAAEVDPPARVAQTGDSGISPQAEETVWCERYHEGRWQKRLWSITHGIWLTDWIDIDP